MTMSTSSCLLGHFLLRLSEEDEAAPHSLLCLFLETKDEFRSS